METKFTKGKWEYIKGCERGFAKVDINGRILDFGDLKFDLDSLDEENANALLISKAPEFYQDAKDDLELFESILIELPLGLQHITNAIKDRKKQKEQLLKEATDL